MIYANSPATLIYSGTEYTMTFDDLKSRLLPGWNLVGIGSNIITPPSWCSILDPYRNVVTQLEPMKAYWIYSDRCAEPPDMAKDLQELRKERLKDRRYG